MPIPTHVTSTVNTSTTPLSGGASYSGRFEEVTAFTSIAVHATADVAGTLYIDWSFDGSATSSTTTLCDSDDGAFGLNIARVCAPYFRVRLLNGSAAQSSLSLKTFYSQTPMDAPTQTGGVLSGDVLAQPVRAILSARLGSGRYSDLSLANTGHLETETHGPVTTDGRVRVSPVTPRVQIDAIYGILASDHETFTDGASGTATTTGNMFVCTTGTTVGGYGVVRSRRACRYRPGQGVQAMFTALFPAVGVANSLVVAGIFNAEDAVFVGYSGATFGLMRRIAGNAHITRLTVTNGATGAETVTITLNDVAFTIASGGVLSTTALAEAIAERVGGYTGWSSGSNGGIISPTSNGATVTFIQNTPGTVSGAFTLTSTGGATGSFSTLQTGAANDSSTGFVARTAWNVDRLDGSNGAYNPSGMTLDVTKLNVFEISFLYLGAGEIRLSVKGPDGEWHLCHIIEYPNSAIVPNFKNPTFRVGWVAASLGSTTALTIKGASGFAGVEGSIVYSRDPVCAVNDSYSATTTAYVALALRVRGEFTGKLNHSEVRPITVDIGNETANRLLDVKVILNPTMTGTVNWSYVNQNISVLEQATPTNVAATGGTQIAAGICATTREIDLQKLDVRLVAGDVIAITIATVSLTATASVAVNAVQA